MRSEASLNPPTCVLPFEMFRTFSPIGRLVPAGQIPSCEITETEKECVLKINLPMFVDATKIKAEVKCGMLTLTLEKLDGMT